MEATARETLMTARTIALGAISAFILLCGVCVGIHLKPLMGKLAAARSADNRPATISLTGATVQLAVDSAIAGSEAWFAPGMAGLTVPGRERLDAIYPLLLRHPELQIEVRGFADNPSVQTLRVGRERAEAVRAYLVFRGLNEDRITATAASESASASIPACRVALILHH